MPETNTDTNNSVWESFTETVKDFGYVADRLPKPIESLINTGNSMIDLIEGESIDGIPQWKITIANIAGGSASGIVAGAGISATLSATVAAGGVTPAGFVVFYQGSYVTFKAADSTNDLVEKYTLDYLTSEGFIQREELIGDALLDTRNYIRSKYQSIAEIIEGKEGSPESYQALELGNSLNINLENNSSLDDNQIKEITDYHVNNLIKEDSLDGSSLLNSITIDDQSYDLFTSNSLVKLADSGLIATDAQYTDGDGNITPKYYLDKDGNRVDANEASFTTQGSNDESYVLVESGSSVPLKDGSHENLNSLISQFTARAKNTTNFIIDRTREFSDSYTDYLSQNKELMLGDLIARLILGESLEESMIAIAEVWGVNAALNNDLLSGEFSEMLGMDSDFAASNGTASGHFTHVTDSQGNIIRDSNGKPLLQTTNQSEGSITNAEIMGGVKAGLVSFLTTILLSDLRNDDMNSQEYTEAGVKAAAIGAIAVFVPGVPVGAIMAIIDSSITAVEDREDLDSQGWQELGTNTAAAVGAAVAAWVIGSKVGMSVGTAITPGIGTVVGAVVGALVGAILYGPLSNLFDTAFEANEELHDAIEDTMFKLELSPDDMEENAKQAIKAIEDISKAYLIDYPVDMVVGTLNLLTGGGFYSDKEFKDGEYPDPYSFLKVMAKEDGTGNSIYGVEKAGVVAMAREYFHDDLYGTDGNDILVGKSGTNTLVGRGGNDLLEGRGDTDQIFGGNGDDIIEAGGENDYVQGDGGNDLIYGDGGDDIILGGTGNDIIYGGDGNDRIEGNDGDDIIKGGAGDDTLVAGSGNDNVEGGAGSDTIFGEAGDDEIDGGDGNDVIDGGSGSDIILGGNGNDNIKGDDGDDEIYGGLGADILYGDSGSDIIHGGEAGDLIFGGIGNDIVYGGTGDDSLYGEIGNDYVLGGEGDDTLDGFDGDDVLFGGLGNDSLDGGDGLDTFVFRAGDGIDVITDSNGSNDLIKFTDIDSSQVILTKDEDDLILTFTDNNNNPTSDQITITNQLSNNNVIETLEFSDGQKIDLTSLTINGDDSITHSTESYQNIDATIQAELAQEYSEELDIDSQGQINTDSTWYDTNYEDQANRDIDNEHYNEVQWRSFKKKRSKFGGHYTVWYQYYEKNLQGSNGNDRIVGNWWMENIAGGNGDDQLYGNGGSDVIYGQNGNDYLNGGSDHDTLHGGDGHDKIEGGTGNDNLDGGNDNDTLHGQWGNDTMYGGSGDDFVDGGQGNDVIRGDTDLEVLTLSKFGLRNGLHYIVADPGHSGNESPGNDILLGGDGDDTIYGEGGNDLLIGNDGSDTLSGGDNNDTIHGRDGTDIISGNDGDDYISGGSGNDVIDGNDGADTLYGNGGIDVIHGNDGNDNIYGGSGNDQLFGDLGDDVIYGGSGSNAIEGNEGDDTITGGEHHDNIQGNEGDDIIFGRSGGDLLNGGDGNDIISGGQGNDILVDGVGSDNLIGGADNDIFIVTKNDQETDQDVVEDFDKDEDRIIIKASYTNPITFTTLQSKMTQVNDHVEINFDSGQTITIKNTLLSDLNQDNIAIGLAGGNDNDILFGTDSNDILFGENGDDQIYGGDGDDELWGGNGADALYGQGGSDILRYEADGVFLSDSHASLVGYSANSTYGHFAWQGNHIHFPTNDQRDYYSDSDVAYKHTDETASSNRWVDIWTTKHSRGKWGHYHRYHAAARHDNKYDIKEYFTKNFYNSEDINIDGYNRSFDSFDGGDGSDVLLMTEGDDMLALDDLTSSNPNAGQARVRDMSVIYANDGNDIINFSSPKYTHGDIIIYAGNGNDKIFSSIGDDTLFGQSGDDVIYGADGNDFIAGGTGDDNLIGGDGNDNIEGNFGDDVIEGNAGDDVIEGGSGSDTLDGGEGDDTISYATSTSGVTVNIANNTASDGDAQGDTISNFENITGSAFADNLTGDENNNIIEGGAGDDILTGGGGSDTYIYNIGDGNDTITDGVNNHGDVITLDESISKSDLIFNKSEDGNDLIIRLKDNDRDSLTITDQLVGDSRIEAISFANNSDQTINLEHHTIVVDEDETITINLDEIEQERIALQNISILPALYGLISYDEDTGLLTYNPNDDFYGMEEISYFTTNDDRSTSEINSFNLLFSPINDDPLGNIENKEVTVDEQFTINLDDYFSDVDGDELTYLVNAKNQVGLPHWLTLNEETNQLTGIFGRSGKLDIEITANDGNGGIFSTSFTISANMDLSQRAIDLPEMQITNGTDNNDTLNAIHGQQDLISAQDGDDVINYVSDGTWQDTAFANFFSWNVYSGDRLSINGKLQSFDSFDGGIGTDTLNLSNGNDVLFLDDPVTSSVSNSARLSGIEIINGGLGDDIIDLSSLNYEYGDVTLNGGDGDDVLWSNSGDDILNGGAGNDNLQAGTGSDILNGDAGDDTLKGYDGDEILTGGTGSDTLTGGFGFDSFNFDALDDSTINSSDLITDFTQGEDSINFSELGFTGIQEGEGSGTILGYSYDQSTDTTTIEDINSDFAVNLIGRIDLNEDDFNF